MTLSHDLHKIMSSLNGNISIFYSLGYKLEKMRRRGEWWGQLKTTFCARCSLDEIQALSLLYSIYNRESILLISIPSLIPL